MPTYLFILQDKASLISIFLLRSFFVFFFHIQSSLHLLNTIIYHCVNARVYVKTGHSDLASFKSKVTERLGISKRPTSLQQDHYTEQENLNSVKDKQDEENLSVLSYISVPISYLSHTSNISNIIIFHSTSIQNHVHVIW